MIKVIEHIACYRNSGAKRRTQKGTEDIAFKFKNLIKNEIYIFRSK